MRPATRLLMGVAVVAALAVAASIPGCSGCKGKAPLAYVPKDAVAVVVVPGIQTAVKALGQLIDRFKDEAPVKAAMDRKRQQMVKELGFDPEKPETMKAKGFDPGKGVVFSLASDGESSAIVLGVSDQKALEKYLRETANKMLGGRATFQDKKVGGRPVIERLGGWLKEMLPLRGKKIVVYHRNWSYFVALFGLKVPATIEPKPGIPPSAKHIVALTELMQKEDVRIVFAANYFDPKKARAVADAVGAEAVIVPLFVGGAPEADDYFKLVDLWVHGLLEAARKKGLI